jgi:hypothetical protein
MSVSWEDLAAGLPTHGDEIMAAHQGAPSIAWQDEHNGAGLPDVDHGDGDLSIRPGV